MDFFHAKPENALLVDPLDPARTRHARQGKDAGGS